MGTFDLIKRDKRWSSTEYRIEGWKDQFNTNINGSFVTEIRIVI